MARRVDNAFTRGWLGLPVHGPMAGTESTSPLGHVSDPSSQRAERTLGDAVPERRSSFPSLRAVAAMLPGPDPDDQDAMFDGAPTRRWSLQLSPMRLVDAMPVWCTHVEAGAEAKPAGQVARSTAHAATVVLNPQYAGRLVPSSLAALCDEACAPVDGRSAVPEWMRIADDCVVVSDEALMRLVLDGRMIGATMVRVEGPVEQADAVAIREAIRSGRPAWQADFRVASVLEMADDRALALVTSVEPLVHLLVGENLRQYLAAVLDEDVDTIGWLAPEQVAELLGASGSLLVRAIETDVFSNFVDVGICTSADEDVPASKAMIYDLPSASWHGE